VPTNEPTSLGDERFLVIERTDQATALYEIDLKGATNILGSALDDPETRPTLEQHGLTGFPTLVQAGIVPMSHSNLPRFLDPTLAETPSKVDRRDHSRWRRFAILPALPVNGPASRRCAA
jgi:hypothetical protein